MQDFFYDSSTVTVYFGMYTIPEGKKRSTLLALIDVFVAISEKKTNKSNKTRAFLRELFRLDLSTAQYTLLCYVPGHCFNACGINPQTNEIFCRERWLNIAVFDREGRDEISVGVGSSRLGEENASLIMGGFYKGGFSVGVFSHNFVTSQVG